MKKSEASKKIPIIFGQITEHNLEMFRVINRVILPVRYHETFYQNILHFPKTVCFFGECLACENIKGGKARAGPRVLSMARFPCFPGGQ